MKIFEALSCCEVRLEGPGGDCLDNGVVGDVIQVSQRMVQWKISSE